MSSSRRRKLTVKPTLKVVVPHIPQVCPHQRMSDADALRLDHVNAQIDAEFCPQVAASLSDVAMNDEYQTCPSVVKATRAFTQMVESLDLNETQHTAILAHFTQLAVPPGTKGVKRGLRFNALVKAHLIGLPFIQNEERFDLKFEQHHPTLRLTSERPDWYLYDHTTHKIVVGMNQLDMWSGGQQANRMAHYLTPNHYNTDQAKLLCVVANRHAPFASVDNKIFSMFEQGFRNQTLCYLKNIENILSSHFGL